MLIAKGTDATVFGHPWRGNGTSTNLPTSLEWQRSTGGNGQCNHHKLHEQARGMRSQQLLFLAFLLWEWYPSPQIVPAATQLAGERNSRTISDAEHHKIINGN